MATKEQPIIENDPSSKVQTQLFLPSHPQRLGEGGLRTKGYFKKSFNDKPLVSVITVVFNGHKHLEQTIQSVLNQSYDNVEYIIIDGGSTDGTLDIIRKYEHAIDYWISEPDKGIYDAMNKGIRCSCGNIIGIVNSDDWYGRNTIRATATAFLTKSDISVFHGVIYRIEQKTGILFRKAPLPITVPIKCMALNHPTMFIKAICYKNLGGYDTSFSLSADFELLCRFIGKGVAFDYCEDIVAYMRSDGLSDRLSYLMERCIEGYAIRKRYGYPLVLNFIRSCGQFFASGLKVLLKCLLAWGKMRWVLELWYKYCRRHITLIDNNGEI
jgi:glycosyltransferase involved in cell wall biosynthesis